MKRKIALLLVLVMVLVPMSAFASISKPGTVATVAADGVRNLGQVAVEVPAGALTGNDTVIITLSDGTKFDNVDWTEQGSGTGYTWIGGVEDPANAGTFIEAGSSIRVPAVLPGTGTANPLVSATIGVIELNDNELRLTSNVTNISERALFYVNLGAVEVEAGYTGDIELTFAVPSGSGFPSGSVVVGRVGSGAVKMVARNTQTSNDTFAADVRITETLAGDLDDDAKSLEFRLPVGYVWTGPTETAAGATHTLTAIYGNNVTYTATYLSGGRILRIGVPAGSANPSMWDLSLAFQVDDESRVKAGDIEVEVTGASVSGTQKLTLGKYGEFGATIAVAGDVPTIHSGRAGQEIAAIEIKESMLGSIIAGRTLTLELPSHARWAREVDSLGGLVGDTHKALTIAASASPYGGTDNRIARMVFSGTSTGAATLTLEDMEIIVEAGYVGDVVVKVGGNAGLIGELKVAEVVAPIAVEAESKEIMVLGRKGQVAGDIIITEAEAGAILEGSGTLVLNINEGTHGATPKVEVLEGNIEIGRITRSGASLLIDVDVESTEASTIKISGLKYDLDRNIAEGDITLRVRGLSVVDTAATNVWSTKVNAATVVNAVVGTPAAGATREAAFTIGSTTFYVGDKAVQADVAPVITKQRTFVPIAWSAMALDVNYVWDKNTQTVTLFGERTVQMTIGSKTMLVNGVPMQMDVTPYIENNRTFVPVAWAAIALGVDYTWDAPTQTVTFK